LVTEWRRARALEPNGSGDLFVGLSVGSAVAMKRSQSDEEITTKRYGELMEFEIWAKGLIHRTPLAFRV
jgi:hypothetical protein